MRLNNVLKITLYVHIFWFVHVFVNIAGVTEAGQVTGVPATRQETTYTLAAMCSQT